MRLRIFCFTGEERANQELQNAFLDESPTQKEAQIHPFKVRSLFAIFDRIVVLRATFRAKIAKSALTLKGCILASF